MTIQQAIEKAIDGGYKCPVNPNYFIFTKAGKDELPRLFLDPLFWRSLGTILGWKKELRMSYEGYCLDDECNTDYRIDEAWRIEEWQYKWHLFIDHLAEGKDAESFFEKL